MDISEYEAGPDEEDGPWAKGWEQRSGNKWANSERISWLEAEVERLQSGWVSVDERLPEGSEVVFVWSGVTRNTDYYYAERWERLGVTHWMPLPSPPKDTCCEAKDTTHEM